MSEQQPGPYGGSQPQQPPGGNGPNPYGYPQQGPYGTPQPGPYGAPPQGGGQQAPNPYAQEGGAQPGPYAQQPGPYAQQPGSYGQQVPQQGYGMPGPPQAGTPTGGGRGRRNGLIIGGAVVVVALAVGAYFVLGGSDGGSGLPDDGPHKLTAPQTVLDTYRKSKDGAGEDDFSEKDVQEMKKYGVDAEVDEVLSADYQTADPSTAQTMADLKDIDLLSYAGAYGKLKNPEKAVDALFKVLTDRSKKKGGTEGPTFVGAPKEFKPAGGDGAVFKCQQATSEMEGGGQNGVPSKMKIAVCAWADHSTMAVAMPTNLGDVMLEEAPSLPKTAALTAKLRKEVRVEK
ncbi:hypothetical protein GA0115251_104323 [Streptomyces sp. TverLS-915]|uniref:hypothetical protein n=1 Tax=Streptomyces sp. TverLS-915 TaxID=1839763 RepID=UPI00081D3D84|nr:hypothetical protein [Streptomyces sp. TverLS-915]SCD34264.1 hypothetical protein GA0115251_104323 [Streptomyces sp. TverLS-915]